MQLSCAPGLTPSSPSGDGIVMSPTHALGDTSQHPIGDDRRRRGPNLCCHPQQEVLSHPPPRCCINHSELHQRVHPNRAGRPHTEISHTHPPGCCDCPLLASCTSGALTHPWGTANATMSQPACSSDYSQCISVQIWTDPLLEKPRPPPFSPPAND